MERLLAFLVKNVHFFVFLLLEIIAFRMIVSFNNHQNVIFQGFMTSVAGQIHTWNASVQGYFNLSEQNELLMKQNFKLQQDLIAAQNQISAIKNQIPYRQGFLAVPDSLMPFYKFNLIPAKVLQQSTRGDYNYLTINKGRRHGITKEMGIISPSGAAGLIIDVTENYAIGMSLLNQHFRLSTKLKKAGYFGTFHWQGNYSDIGYLEYIPLHLRVGVGDTVITSSNSTYFPEGVMVGKVISVLDPKNGQGFHQIKVKLFTNFNSIEHVFLAKHERKFELDSLYRTIIKPK